MKRWMISLLILALLLSMSACSLLPNKPYAELIAQLDAGNSEGVSRELSKLLPEFAQDQQKLAVYDKYESLINALESKDSSAASGEFYNRLDQIQNEGYTYVDITADNWQQYFDLSLVPYWSEDLFGDADHLWFQIALTIREEYRDRVMRMEYGSAFDRYFEAITGGSHIDVELAWHFQDTYLQVDYPTRTYIWEENVLYGDFGDRLEQSSVYSFSQNDGNTGVILSCGYPTVNYEGRLVCPRVTDLELCRIQGKLPLKNQ